MNMKRLLFLSTLCGVAAWSASGGAAANWDSGACPQPHTGAAPCFETQINGNTYHFNGSGGHSGDWHGLPEAEGGGDFQFSSDAIEVTCSATSARCGFSSSGQVKKCQDSSGVWRIGVRVNAVDLSPGDFLCNFVTVGGFPWYSKDTTIANHCPFEDDCDSFIPYDSSASTYTADFGSVDVGTSLGSLIDGEHLQGVVFTPGVGDTLDFSNKTFFACDETERDCSVDGILTLDNATSFDIY